MARQTNRMHPRYKVSAYPKGMNVATSGPTPKGSPQINVPRPPSKVPPPPPAPNAPAPPVGVPSTSGGQSLTRQAVTGTSEPAPTINVPSTAGGQSLTRQAVTGTSEPAPDIWVPKTEIPSGDESDEGAPPAPTQEDGYKPGYYEQQATLPALGAMRAAAAGESPVDRRIANLYLGYLRAGNEAEKASAAHEMAQLGVSPQAAAARMAMLGQRQGSQEAQTAGQLAVQSQERALGAAQQLGRLGMQGAGLEQRKYEFGEEMGYKRDVLSEQERQFNAKHEEDIRQFNERQDFLRDQEENRELWSQYDALIQAGDYDGAAQVYEQISGQPMDVSTLKDAEERRIRNELMPQVEDRINNMMAAGRGFQEISNDQETREMLAEALNEDINSDRIDTELRNLYDAELARDQPKAKANLSSYLAAAAQKGTDVETLVADEDIWRNAAYSKQLDPYDLKNKAEIEEHIRNEYEAYNRSAIDMLVDTAMNDMFELYTDNVPQAESDLRKVITDAWGTAITTNAEGEMQINEDVYWPWENPETMFNYVGWNGEDLSFTEDGNLTPESETLMQETVYTTDDGQPITAQAAVDKWESLTSTERSQFIDDDGNIKKEAFLASEHGFGTAKAPDDSTIHTSVDYWDQFMLDNPALLDEFDADILPDFANLELGGGGDANDPTVFAYNNAYGDPKEAALAGPLLPRIYFQFREVFGDDLTARQFADIWNEGEGWIVDDNGLVKNFDPQWRQDNELPESSGFDTPTGYRLTSWQMGEYRKQGSTQYASDKEPVEEPRTIDDITSDDIDNLTSEETDEIYGLMRIHDPANESSWKNAPLDELIAYLNQVVHNEGPGAQEIHSWLTEHGLYVDVVPPSRRPRPGR